MLYLVAAPLVVVLSAAGPWVASLEAAQTAVPSAAGLDQHLRARTPPWPQHQVVPCLEAGLCAVRWSLDVRAFRDRLEQVLNDMVVSTLLRSGNTLDGR